MAKTNAPKKKAASTKKPATKAPAPKKAAAAKAAKKKAPAKKKDDHEELAEYVLDPTEEKAFELVQTSDCVGDELEAAAIAALGQAVRKVLGRHGVSLTPGQAQNVAFVLFSE
ncbi:MAG: hypothetical protein ACYC35_19400 [Pirellulales bacterium]